MEINKILNKLVEGKDLTLAEAEELIDQMAKGRLSHDQMVTFLTALKDKGETVDEITGFIKGMRKHMIKLPAARHPRQQDANTFRSKMTPILDIVGTGGDGIGSFNISTASAFVVAGAGIKVAKHGNRAASSKCGSADVLEALGVNINLTAPTAQTVLNKVGMVFLFAPLYHPAMKIIGPVRKELGFRTVFNFLGPFLNPAQVKYQLLGVPGVEIARKLAEVSLNLGYKHLLLVVSEDGMDEISLSGLTHGFEVKDGKIKKLTIDPQDYGYEKIQLKEILGGDASENAQIIKDILNGNPGPKRDTVLLNCAFALSVAGRVKNIKQGIKLSEQSINSGAAKKILENLIRETQKHA